MARLAKNAVANLLRLGVNWLVVLLVAPLLVRLLDRPSYATWMLILQLGAYATLFDGGLQLAIGRYVARAEQSGDRQYLGEILSSAAVLLSAGAVLVLLLIGGLTLSFGHLFHSVPEKLLPQATLALLFVGGSLGLAFPFSVLAGLSLGLEKNQVNAAAGAVSKILGAAGTIWAAFHHQGLVVMALWIAAGTLSQPLIFLLASRGMGLRSLLHRQLVRLRMIREFGKFCSAMVVSQLSSLLITGLDLPIVAAFDFRNAGYYAVAATVSNMLIVPHGAVLSTIVPMMSSMSAREQAERMGQALLRITRVSMAMLLLVSVPLMTGMSLLLRIWVGPGYMEHTLLLGELLVGAQFVRLTLMPYTLIGFSAGEQNRMLISPVSEGLVNLLLSLVLVRSMGAAGVAVGTLIGAFVGFALHFLNSMPRTRSMAFSRRKLLWTGMGRPLLWSLLPAVALAWLLRAVPGTLNEVLILLILTAILSAILWDRVLGPEDRVALRGLGAHLRSVLQPNRGTV